MFTFNNSNVTIYTAPNNSTPQTQVKKGKNADVALKCFVCGKTGHFKKECPRRDAMRQKPRDAPKAPLYSEVAKGPGMWPLLHSQCFPPLKPMKKTPLVFSKPAKKTTPLFPKPAKKMPSDPLPPPSASWADATDDDAMGISSPLVLLG